MTEITDAQAIGKDLARPGKIIIFGFQGHDVVEIIRGHGPQKYRWRFEHSTHEFD
jgi:hypothetical protein